MKLNSILVTRALDTKGIPSSRLSFTSFDLTNNVLVFENIMLALDSSWFETSLGEVFFDYIIVSIPGLTPEQFENKKVEKVVESIDIFGRYIPEELLGYFKHTDKRQTHDLFVFKFTDNSKLMMQLDNTGPFINFDSSDNHISDVMQKDWDSPYTLNAVIK